MKAEIQIAQDLSLSDVGKVFAQSGFFQDSREAAQAIVKIMAGQELGFPPVMAMTSVYIVNGRPALSASVMGALIKRHPKYDYTANELSAERCEIEFFEIRSDGSEKSIGKSEFTMADAKKARTQNTDKFPRNMLFARALSNGARWFTPDVFMGPVYVPEELGVEGDATGNVVEAEATVESAGGAASLNAALKSPETAGNGAGEAEQTPAHKTTPVESAPAEDPKEVAEAPAPAEPPADPDPEPETTLPESTPEVGPEETTEEEKGFEAAAKEMDKGEVIRMLMELEKTRLTGEGIKECRIHYIRALDLNKGHVADLRKYYVFLASASDADPESTPL